MRNCKLLAILFSFILLNEADAQSIEWDYFYKKKKIDSLLKLNSYDKAHALLKENINFKSSTARDLYKLGICYFELNKYKKANKYFNQSLNKGLLFRDSSQIQNDSFLIQNHHRRVVAKFEKKAYQKIAVKTKLNQILLDSLLLKRNEDQKYRIISKINFAKSKADSLNNLRLETDKLNQYWLKSIILKYGWPGRDKVGYDGDNAAWLIVQHADNNINFQKEMLVVLQEQITAGTTSSSNVAYLIDRILVNEGNKQIFGTQFDTNITPNSIELNIKLVQNYFLLNTLRSYYGLPSIETYIKTSTEYLKKKHGIK